MHKRVAAALLAVVAPASFLLVVGGFPSPPAGAVAPVALTLGTSGSGPYITGLPVTLTGTVGGGNSPFSNGQISMTLYSDSGCASPIGSYSYPANPGTVADGTYTLGTYIPTSPGTYYADGFFYGTDTTSTLAVSSTGCVELFTATNQYPTAITTHGSATLRMKFATVTFNAMLTNQTTGQPIPGQKIKFTMDNSLGSCSASTNGSGVASCSIEVSPWQRLDSTHRYTASFLGTSLYESSSTTGYVSGG